MGKWIHLDTSYKSYVNPDSIHCQACGKMIPKDVWMSEREGKEIPFCNEECVRMYDYMKTRRRKS